MNEIRFIDLFSGIGGFRLGLEKTNSQINGENRIGTRVGNSERRNKQYPSRGRRRTQQTPHHYYRCVWSCDFNKYANQVYTKRFGDEGHYTADIRGVNPDEIPDVDLLCAGFPCQAFSTAGKRKGFQDTRGTLFFEICRIAEAKRPSLLLLENVKGLLNHDRGRTFTIILQTLDDMGYWVEWQVLNSKHFGVPQNRERVFIIGHLRGTGRQEIFPITESSKSPNFRNAEEQVALALQNPGHAAGNYRGMNMIVADRSRHLAGKGRNLESPKPITNALSSVQKDNYLFNQTEMRRLTPIEYERLQGFPDGWTAGLSDTQRYSVLANAVTINVIEFLGEQILSLFTNNRGQE